ncbi:MAG TPA: hypothetical protein PLK93_06590, partial [Clostridiales bacterium]|nr:hypothetical protein [Clostridiales bacterium]
AGESPGACAGPAAGRSALPSSAGHPYDLPRRAAAMRGGVGRYDGEREDAFSDSLFKKIKSTAGLCFTLAGL